MDFNTKQKTVWLQNGGLRIRLNSTKVLGPEENERRISAVNQIAELVESLDGYLDFGLHFGESEPTVLVKKLHRIVQNPGNLDKLNIELGGLELLRQNLDYLFGVRPDIAGDLVDVLVKQRTNEAWQGPRFELFIACSLIKKLGPDSIEKRESPDFAFSFRGSRLSAEVTTAQLQDGNRDKHYGYKIRSAIHKKNKKDYPDGDMILYIDVTNVVYSEAQRVSPTSYEEVFKAIADDEGIKFGSVILYWFNYNAEEGRYESIPRRIDTSSCSEALHGFLEVHHPISIVDRDHLRLGYEA